MVVNRGGAVWSQYPSPCPIYVTDRCSRARSDRAAWWARRAHRCLDRRPQPNAAGLEPKLNTRAVEIAYGLEFEPALGDADDPIETDYRWTFLISGS